MALGDLVVGQIIREMRFRFEWTQQELASKFAEVGVSACHQVISKWEAGRGAPCKPEIIRGIREIYRDAASEYNKTAIEKIPAELEPLHVGSVIIQASLEQG